MPKKFTGRCRLTKGSPNRSRATGNVRRTISSPLRGILANKYPDLDGTGAAIKGGRWNSSGNPVVYTSSCGAPFQSNYQLNPAHADFGQAIKDVRRRD